MIPKSRVRVYGKKGRQQDKLEDAFVNLSLDKSSPKTVQTREDLLRSPLQTISSDSVQQHASGQKQGEGELKRQYSRNNGTRSCTGSRTQRSDSKTSTAMLTSLEHVRDEIYGFERACHMWAHNYQITKIAHGSYAAIFRLQLRSDRSKYIIAKLMPIKPKHGKGSRAADQTSMEDAATEIKALDTMSEIPGFVGFSEAWILRGALPALFQQQYKAWALSHPDDGFIDYSNEQLWCFIEMSDAGTDLERILLKDARLDGIFADLDDDKLLKPTHCWDIFWGIAEALGRGEEFAEFEHRDLHPGNICIIKSDNAKRPQDQQSFRKRYTQLEVTLIDYTLSRARSANGEILANPMSDQTIFEQRIQNPCTQQQRNDNKQYETYRQMRKLVIELSGGQNDGQAWQSFVPRTNVLWLHHILCVLLCGTNLHNQASARKRGLGSTVKENHMGTSQVTKVATVRGDAVIAAELALTGLLKKLKDDLDADSSNGCQWDSAKALVESELYWTSEACGDDDAVLGDEHV